MACAAEPIPSSDAATTERRWGECARCGFLRTGRRPRTWLVRTRSSPKAGSATPARTSAGTCSAGLSRSTRGELYAAGHLTNPNILVIGHVGEGKSSLVKTLLWRSSVFGRSAVVADPKGEYGPLAAAYGVEPVRIGPGLPARLNRSTLARRRR